MESSSTVSKIKPLMSSTQLMKLFWLLFPKLLNRMQIQLYLRQDMLFKMGHGVEWIQHKEQDASIDSLTWFKRMPNNWLLWKVLTMESHGILQKQLILIFHINATDIMLDGSIRLEDLLLMLMVHFSLAQLKNLLELSGKSFHGIFLF